MQRLAVGALPILTIKNENTLQLWDRIFCRNSSLLKYFLTSLIIRKRYVLSNATGEVMWSCTVCHHHHTVTIIFWHRVYIFIRRSRRKSFCRNRKNKFGCWQVNTRSTAVALIGIPAPTTNSSAYLRALTAVSEKLDTCWTWYFYKRFRYRRRWLLTHTWGAQSLIAINVPHLWYKY